MNAHNIARRINVNEPLDEGYAENMKQKLYGCI